jgi:hypothetical protein
MAVQPTQPDRIGRSGLGRARRTLGDAPESLKGDRAPRPPVQPEDSVQISSTAETLHQASSDFQTSDADLSPERLKQVLNRISNGFYQRPEVRAEVARKLANSLGDS